VAPEGGEPTLLCTSRAHKRHKAHTREYTCALSPSLFISLSRTRVRVHNVPMLSRRSLAIARAESGEHSRAFTHLYASDAGLVYGSLVRTLGRTVSLARVFSCTPLHRIVSRARARYACVRACVRACVSTCERTVCLHAKRQRHAVPHTGNPSSWDPSLASFRLVSSRSALRHLASLTYDTIRTSHKAGR